MCGGDLRIEEGTTVAECEYCGTKQTVPNADNEKKIKLFERANRLRAACEFDKAAGVYESIVADFDTEAEAYWGLILCKFGIEYVDDPATGDKVPTCHRSSFDSVLEDPNFELVMENSDAISRKVYRDEAKAIEELRRSIIEVSSKEEPYDVFISYKELDASGERTIDSVIAQDIYKELTNEGYRVFFSRIILHAPGLAPVFSAAAFFAIELLYRVDVIEYELLSLGLIQHDGVHRVFAPELLRYQAEAAPLRRGELGLLARGQLNLFKRADAEKPPGDNARAQIFHRLGVNLFVYETCDLRYSQRLIGRDKPTPGAVAQCKRCAAALCRLFALDPTVFYDAAQNIRNIIHAARYSDIV